LDSHVEKNSGVGKGNDMWGKRWTRRTAAGYLFKREVEEEMQSLIAAGSHTHMSAYQPALTNVWNGLSEEDQARCDDEARKWNTEAWPREQQMEYVILLWEHEYLIDYSSREAKTQLHRTVTTFMNDLHRKMGVHVVILTTHVNENDQASVSK
jgi:hypothetical protein